MISFSLPVFFCALFPSYIFLSAYIIAHCLHLQSRKQTMLNLRLIFHSSILTFMQSDSSLIVQCEEQLVKMIEKISSYGKCVYCAKVKLHCVQLLNKINLHRLYKLVDSGLFKMFSRWIVGIFNIQIQCEKGHKQYFIR